MENELSLVPQLAVILIAAGVFTILFKVLKQPMIIGYIVAGFLVGPHLKLIPQFDSESVEAWSQIGIIFLLFGLGLEFSFKKILKVGTGALLTAGLNCVLMFFVGILLGMALGWTSMEGIFLGGMLSMSSTTIIIKAYDEMGLKSKPYASLIFGTLVVEDLIAVLLMVLLSTMAVANKFAGKDMLFALGKLVFFIALWFIVGMYVLPTLFTKAKKWMSDEILLLVSMGLCFLMVVFATSVGFSSALGAFVMGSLLSETIESERIEKITTPLKDLFGAIFFVSVGMMVNPAIIVEYWGAILVITIVVLIGKCLCSIGGVLLGGKGLSTATHVGFSLAQLGEFSFIIAGLGTQLGVMREFIYPIIVTVSVVTTFTTPYMIKVADPATDWFRRILPPKWLANIDKPDVEFVTGSKAESNDWKELFKLYFLRIGIYSIIIISILSLSNAYLDKACVYLFPSMEESARHWIDLGVTLAILSPFLIGIGVSSGSIQKSVSRLVSKKNSNKWPILSLMAVRILIALSYCAVAIRMYVDLGWWVLLLFFIFGFILMAVFRSQKNRTSHFERHFLDNLSKKEKQHRKEAPVTAEVQEKLAGYDVRLRPVQVPSDFAFIGKTLREMPFRHTSGVNIVKIKRGNKSILVPAGDEVIYPADILLAVGTEEQLHAFEQIMKENTPAVTDSDDEHFSVENFTINEDSQFFEKSLREARIKSSGCMVISIARNGELITNPTPDTRFEKGDIVWIAGQKSSVDYLTKS